MEGTTGTIFDESSAAGDGVVVAAGCDAGAPGAGGGSAGVLRFALVAALPCGILASGR